MCEQTCHSRFAPVHSAHARFSWLARSCTNAIDVYNWSIDLSFFMIGVKIVYTILSSNSLFHCCLDDLAVPVLDQVYDHEHSENGVEQSPNETEDLCERERERECLCVIQWNLSNLDTNGAEESVIVSEVSSFQRLKCMQEWYLGWEKVSCLERCPQFRSVLIEREVPQQKSQNQLTALAIMALLIFSCSSTALYLSSFHSLP